MMHVYDNLTERGSVHQADSRNQCEDPIQSAYNEIPLCPTVDWCQAAAFRFNLPGCEATGERNEYLAFIIPRKKQEKKSPPPKPVERQEHHEKYDKKDYYVPQHIPNCRWSTEYSSTIDDCARRVMSMQPRCKRSPIYPKKCCLGNATERPPSPCYKTQRSRPVIPKNECYPVKPSRTQDICRNVSPQRMRKQVQPRQKITECERPLMIEPSTTRPITFCDDSPKLPKYCTTQRPCSNSLPVDECSSRNISEQYEPMQRSTGRPMPRCTS